MKELFRGAEAVIYKVNDSTLLKKRVRKGYRISELDTKLRKSRTKTETNLLRRARGAGVNVPKVFKIKDFSFKMTYLKGFLLRDVIKTMKKKELQELFSKIGEQVSLMHESNIVHGDLTTSNMILVNGVVYFFDFSLGALSKKVEDKAVDLHLIKQALIAKHNKNWVFCFNALKNSYNNESVLQRLKSVEKRGRKKS